MRGCRWGFCVPQRADGVEGATRKAFKLPCPQGSLATGRGQGWGTEMPSSGMSDCMAHRIALGAQPFPGAFSPLSSCSQLVPCAGSCGRVWARSVTAPGYLIQRGPHLAVALRGDRAKPDGYAVQMPDCDGWSPGEVSSMIANPFYAIHIDEGPTLPHEPMISEG
jgi:hypothetical protein